MQLDQIKKLVRTKGNNQQSEETNDKKGKYFKLCLL